MCYLRNIYEEDVVLQETSRSRKTKFRFAKGKQN